MWGGVGGKEDPGQRGRASGQRRALHVCGTEEDAACDGVKDGGAHGEDSGLYSKVTGKPVLYFHQGNE